MSRKVTSKRPNSAKNVSHAHNRTNKTQNLNFQYVTINGIKFKVFIMSPIYLKNISIRRFRLMPSIR